MGEVDLVKKYAGGLVMYHESDTQRKFPNNWLIDSKSTDGGNLYLQAYDANLMPLPNIKDWPEHSKGDMCAKISEVFKDKDFNVYLDGHLLEQTKKMVICK